MFIKTIDLYILSNCTIRKKIYETKKNEQNFYNVSSTVHVLRLVRYSFLFMKVLQP